MSGIKSIEGCMLDLNFCRHWDVNSTFFAVQILVSISI